MAKDDRSTKQPPSGGQGDPLSFQDVPLSIRRFLRNMFDTDLLVSEIKVLLAIAGHLDRGSDLAWPSPSKLMSLTHLGKTSVYGALTSLRKKGYIEDVDHDGRRKYRVLAVIENHRIRRINKQNATSNSPPAQTGEAGLVGHMPEPGSPLRKTESEPPQDEFAQSDERPVERKAEISTPPDSSSDRPEASSGQVDDQSAPPESRSTQAERDSGLPEESVRWSGREGIQEEETGDKGYDRSSEIPKIRTEEGKQPGVRLEAVPPVVCSSGLDPRPATNPDREAEEAPPGIISPASSRGIAFDSPGCRSSGTSEPVIHPTIKRTENQGAVLLEVVLTERQKQPNCIPLSEKMRAFLNLLFDPAKERLALFLSGIPTTDVASDLLVRQWAQKAADLNHLLYLWIVGSSKIPSSEDVKLAASQWLLQPPEYRKGLIGSLTHGVPDDMRFLDWFHRNQWQPEVVSSTAKGRW